MLLSEHLKHPIHVFNQNRVHALHIEIHLPEQAVGMGSQVAAVDSLQPRVEIEGLLLF